MMEIEYICRPAFGKTDERDLGENMRKGLRLLLSLFLCAFVVANAKAQTKTGTTIGQFTLIEPSARISAMGNAGVTTFQEVESGFYNPGALGHMDQSDVQFTHGVWLAGITYNYGAAAIRVGSANTLILSVTALSSGEIDVRTVEQPSGTGERYTVNDIAFGLGYARRITDRFSAGGRVNYLQETIWHSSMSAFAFDFGILYELPFRAYLGASLTNFGTRSGFNGRDLAIRYDLDPDRFGDNSNVPARIETDDWALPVLFRVGVGVPVTLNANNQIHLVIDASQPSDNNESISVGAEWTFMKVFSARAGYQNLFLTDSEGGLAAGAGLNIDISSYTARFDYSWNAFGRLDNVQRFTVGFSF